ncbi:MAG: hypothetical protein FWE32_02540 [Oscillospiraceae bacterium]|nr:hypothetical protein [Oscillospiraceae bacterium]
MAKVKGFSAFTIQRLEKEINAFLFAEGIKLIDIRHSSTIFENTALVIYEEIASSKREE